MKKELILKTIEFNSGGFWEVPHAIMEIIRREGDKEESLGSYVFSGSSAYAQKDKVEAIGRKYEEMGYDLLGDW